jgi:hypothetical protein
VLSERQALLTEQIQQYKLGQVVRGQVSVFRVVCAVPLLDLLQEQQQPAATSSYQTS